MTDTAKTMARTRNYGQFCPVALAATILTERWTPLVIRELLCGSVRFNDLQRGVPRMSSALLAQRLKQLQFAGIVTRQRGAGGMEYHLTPAGRELFPVIREMGMWSQRWLRHDLVDTDNLDADLLMWDIRRNALGHAPAHANRYVVEFRLSGVPINRRRYWLVFDGETIDLCYRDPGFEVALFVEANLRLLTRIWLGHIPVAAAISDGELRLDGARADITAFQSWFVLSLFAGTGRAER